MKGIVVAIKYGIYSVLVDGNIFQTSPRGLFKSKDRKIVVGDKVELEEDNFLIVNKLERTSFIKRPEIANIDQILIVFSLSKPSFSYFLACKYLTFANYYSIPAKLVLTKSDIAEKIDEEEIVKTFSSIGVDTYVISNKTNDGIEEVKKVLENKITCLMGQSGVGKSSLLNSLDENLNREIGEYSEALGRGKHQTKEVVLLPFLGGFIADTPGFSSLELDMTPLEVARYFPGFINKATKCYYSDCLHQSESRCEIKKSLEEGNISSILYENYLKLLEEVKNNG